MKRDTDAPRAYVLVKGRAYPPVTRTSNLGPQKHCHHAQVPTQPMSKQEFFWIPVAADRAGGESGR